MIYILHTYIARNVFHLTCRHRPHTRQFVYHWWSTNAGRHVDHRDHSHCSHCWGYDWVLISVGYARQYCCMDGDDGCSSHWRRWDGIVVAAVDHQWAENEPSCCPLLTTVEEDSVVAAALVAATAAVVAVAGDDGDDSLRSSVSQRQKLWIIRWRKYCFRAMRDILQSKGSIVQRKWKIDQSNDENERLAEGRRRIRSHMHDLDRSCWSFSKHMSTYSVFFISIE